MNVRMIVPMKVHQHTTLDEGADDNNVSKLKHNFFPTIVGSEIKREYENLFVVTLACYGH